MVKQLGLEGGREAVKDEPPPRKLTFNLAPHLATNGITDSTDTCGAVGRALVNSLLVSFQGSG